jgi:prepilin peptidase CpaA
MTANEFMTALLVAFLLSAVLIDHKYRRIPNLLSGTLLASGLLINSAALGVPGLAAAIGGLLVGLGIFVIPYLMRGMAAGDVKLMCAVGACLGTSQAIVASCAALIAGGIMGVTLVAFNNYRNPETNTRAALAMRFPYASAIAAGASVALLI